MPLVLQHWPNRGRTSPPYQATTTSKR
jgi:hypothetical protein